MNDRIRYYSAFSNNFYFIFSLFKYASFMYNYMFSVDYNYYFFCYLIFIFAICEIDLTFQCTDSDEFFRIPFLESSRMHLHSSVEIYSAESTSTVCDRTHTPLDWQRTSVSRCL